MVVVALDTSMARDGGRSSVNVIVMGAMTIGTLTITSRCRAGTAEHRRVVAHGWDHARLTRVVRSGSVRNRVVLGVQHEVNNRLCGTVHAMLVGAVNPLANVILCDCAD